MKLIIPMAGQGSRLRPHSLTTPKPLLPVAGPMLIERIVRSFIKSIDKPVEEIAFILGDFGKHVEERLAEMTINLGAQPVFYYQEEALGTAHAVHCAAPSLKGEVIVAFADTLFQTGGNISFHNADSIIWLKKVDDPSRYGVAVMEDGQITRFVEKPVDNISDLAIIGVYYFKKGEQLLKELQYVLSNNIRGHKNEFDLTDAIDRLLQNNAVFRAADVTRWLDFGTIQAWMESTAVLLDDEHPKPSKSAIIENSTIIEPSYIGENANISNSTIGPYACIGNHTQVSNSQIKNSIVQHSARIVNSKLANVTVGQYADINGCQSEIHVGDYSQIKPGLT